jgi:adenosylcobyric acid synthase
MVGDIDRGGVIASLVGTDSVLDEQDKSLIKSFIINKFRGDTSLFSEGMKVIEQATGWTGIGILPWFADARFLPAEDILDLSGKTGHNDTQGGTDALHVAVPVLRRIANFDDLDPLSAEPGVRLTLVASGEAIPGDADLILLPGSKATIDDLEFLREQGWDIDINAHVRRGGVVMGLCGGYQMLGTGLADPHGIEGEARSVAGLGLLSVETTIRETKTLNQVTGVSKRFGAEISGYEIHMGHTDGADCARPVVQIEGRPEGASSPDGRIIGSYVHGIFADNGFRTAFLADLAARRNKSIELGMIDFAGNVDAILDQLASHMARHLDMDALAELAGL